jgi:hypothetical protein
MKGFNNIEVIKSCGFNGYKTVEYLWTNLKILPKQKGVYLVLNPNYKNIKFILPGVGGFLKDKNPNVPIEELQNNLVLDSLVVYIGKAGDLSGKSNLHKRLRQYLRFGQGKKIGHWGGRYIWQLANHKDLIICWKVTEQDNPRDVEKKLINEYCLQFHKLPFANLTK